MNTFENSKIQASNTSATKPKRNQFLICLHKALGKPEYEGAMCWDQDGSAFMLKNPDVIAEKILTAEFSGMKFSSFIRQLSYYGFKRISRKSNTKVYFHENFQRDKKDQLKLIKRNCKEIEGQRDEVNQREEVSQSPSHKQNDEEHYLMELMQQKLALLQSKLDEVRHENQSLRQCVQTLRAQQATQPNPMEAQEMYSRDYTKRAQAGINQTFFNLEHNNTPYYVYPTASVESNVAPISYQNDFVEIYQPSYKNNQAHYYEEFTREQSSTHSVDPFQMNLYEREPNMIKSFANEPEDDLWNFNNFLGEDL